MPSVQFATKAIDGSTTQFESGKEVVFLLTYTGANPSQSTVVIECPAFAQNPAIAMVPISTSTRARTIKVNATINADAGAYTATIQSAMGATVGLSKTATFTVVTAVTVGFATPLISTSVDAPYEAGDMVEFQLEATGANKNVASVELHCDAFVRNPLPVKIPAASRFGGSKPRKVKADAVVLKGAAGTYTVELKENNNCALATVTTATFDMVDPVKVSFATPAFKEGVADLTPEQKVTLCLTIDRMPKKDIEVTVRCPGFGKSAVLKTNLSTLPVKLKKKQDPADPIEETIILVKEEGTFRAAITVPKGYLIGTPDSFDFVIGPKRVLASLPQDLFVGVAPDAVQKDDLRDVKITLSEPPEADIKLTLSSAGFDPPKHEFVVKKGQASSYTIPQKFKLVGDPGQNVVTLSVTDTILKNPVDVTPGAGTASYFLPWPPGAPVLEFATPAYASGVNGAKNFAPGEVVRFFLQLDRAVPVRGPVILYSDAFAETTIGNNRGRFAVAMIEKGRTPDNPPTVEVTLREDIVFRSPGSFQMFTVGLRAKPEHFTLGTNQTAQIDIRSFPVAAFSQKLAMKPKSDDGYDAGTQVTFRLELSEPAGRGGGVTAVLKSPLFSTSTQDPAGEHTVTWEEGQDLAMVDARIRTSQIDVVNGGDYEVELVEPVTKCLLTDDDAKRKVTVTIRPLPAVSYRTAWIEPATGPYRVGQLVTLLFELDREAPDIGAKFQLTSPLFNAPVDCEFVAGERVLKVKVLLDKPSPTGAQSDIDITMPDPLYGCRPSETPEDLKAKLEVLPSPNVKFSVDWIDPAGVSVYAEGSTVKITCELDAPAPVDAYARISSTAFGGKSYVVQFPKGTMSQGAIIQTGKEDHPEKLLKPLLTSSRGRRAIRGLGYGMVLDKPVTPLAKSTDVVLKVGYMDRVSKAIKSQDILVTPIRGCAGSDTRSIQVRPNLQRKLDDPMAPCPYGNPPVEPPKYCNMHRLVVQEKHGKNPAARGHDGNGSYEVIVSDSAPKRFRGAVVSPMRIQMIAGKALWQVDDKPFHKTTIDIYADRKDYFCDDLFPSLDRKEGGRPHPHVTILQKKPYRLEAFLAGGSSGAAQFSLEKLELPEYPGWIVINPELGGTASALLKWYKLEKLEPTAPNALLGRPLWTMKLKKRRQGFDKILTKAIAKLVGKQELIFSDDDEALAEAANLGIDTSAITGGLSLGVLIKSIMTIWVPRIEQYQVILESCGNPDPGKPTPKIPAPRLVTMIEVYPSDEFCLYANVSPVPAMQFGNDGQYIALNGRKDNESVNNTALKDDLPVITNASENLGNAMQPLTDKNLGPLSGSMITNPVEGFVGGVTAIGSQAPSENYVNNEKAQSSNNNQFGQMQSHGGGQVFETPELRKQQRDEYSQHFAQLSVKPQFTYLTTGQGGFEIRRKDPLATPPRYPAPTPKTRVFHQVMETDRMGGGGGIGSDITRDWNTAKIGLVVNGQEKPQFQTFMVAAYGLLFVIRHWSDFWRAMQEMVPSWGWGVTFDLGFLEGGLRIRWGWKEYEDWQVFRWWQMEINCNLVRLMVELWAGLKARALFVKFEAVAYLRITGMLSVKASIERVGPSPRDVEGEFQLTDHKNDKKVASWDADLAMTTTAEVGLRIVLIHDGCVKANGALKTGYSLKFRFKEPIGDTIGLTLEGYFLGVSFKLTAQVIGVKKFIQKEFILIPGDPDGRPRFRRILFPKGSHGQKTPWKAKDQLELIWQKVAAEVAKLDEALNDWYRIQLDLVLRRDKAEYEKLANTDPRAEWPWSDDPGVSIQQTPTGYAMKSTEDAKWRQQWVICKEALEANRVTPIWAVFGDKDFDKKKLEKYKKSPMKAIPKLGRTLHQKVEPSKNLAADLLKETDKAELGVEKVKQAIATINIKFISTLVAIDQELERFADEDMKVSEEVLEKIEEAKEWAKWGVHSEKLDIDTRGTVNGIVEDALDDFDIKKLSKLVYQVNTWNAGGATTQPKLFATVDTTKITDRPSAITLWIGGTSHTIIITGKNHLVGLRNTINAAELGVIASIEPSGRSFYLVLSPERPLMGNLGCTDGPNGPLITGRK